MSSVDFEQSFTLSNSGTSVAGNSEVTPAQAPKQDEVPMKVSMCYNKGISKLKCGLCHMYFHKSSVIYTTPNHRILELHKGWGIKKEGARYKNASFLYTTTIVCKFCSQFFHVMPEDCAEPEAPPKSEDSKLEIKTELQRTNVACNTRAYQSSCVDGKSATLAINVPYDLMAKTKREVDPWWEVDLQRPFHIHSIKFKLLTGIRQKQVVNVFLMSQPCGFEDPFLDSVRGKALCSFKVELHASDSNKMKEIEWTLPDSTIGSVVRIQLQGIRVLGVQEFVAWQGDNLVMSKENDFLPTQNSLASLSPEKIRMGLRDMTSPQKVKEYIQYKTEHNENVPHKKEKLDTKKVNTLKMQIREKYSRMEVWRQKCVQLMTSYSAHELAVLYKVVFKYTADMDSRNAVWMQTNGSPFKAVEATLQHDIDEQGSLADDTSINTDDTQAKAHRLAAEQSPLMSSAVLMEHYPRCDLEELHQRLRSVLRWVQTGTQKKLINALIQGGNFDVVANDPQHHLYALQSAFKRMEYYWNKKEAKEQRKSTTGGSPTKLSSSATNTKSGVFLTSDDTGTGSPDRAGMGSRKSNKRGKESGEDRPIIGTTVAEARGCSWSQFLIIIALLNTEQTQNIPADVFLVTDERTCNPSMMREREAYAHRERQEKEGIHIPELLLDDQTLDTAAGRTVSTYSLQNSSAAGGGVYLPNGSMEAGEGLGLGGRSSMWGVGGGGRGGGDGEGGTSVDRLSRPKTTSTRGNKSRGFGTSEFDGGVNMSVSIQERTRDPLKPMWNSSFAEYKFANFKRRIAGDMVFPKHLSLSFAATLIPKRDATSSGQEYYDDDESGDGSTPNDASSQRSSRSLSNSLDKSSVSSGPAPPLQRGLSRSASRKNMSLSSSLPALNTQASQASMPGAPIDPEWAQLKKMGIAPPRSPSKAPSSRNLLSASMDLSVNNKAGADAFNATASAPGSPVARNTKTPKTPLSRSGTSGGKRVTLPPQNSTGSFDTGSVHSDGGGRGGGGSGDMDDWGDMDDEEGESSGKKKSGGKEVVDFFRYCAMCNFKYPRSAGENKVFRKHIVKLMSAWDEKLVSKEIRSLDNTISMYNLMDVCLFCSQYFDPDFPDGIAYPMRSGPFVNDKKVEGPLGAVAIAAVEKPPGVEFYDQRHVALDLEVGQVFRRPKTIDSRVRAQRAGDVVREQTQRELDAKERQDEAEKALRQRK